MEKVEDRTLVRLSLIPELERAFTSSCLAGTFPILLQGTTRFKITLKLNTTDIQFGILGSISPLPWNSG
jgi:hypothetical protein